MITENKMKDAERIVRLIMITILLTAGTSKFFSDGGFFDYYAALFQGELRIRLPAPVVNAYLALIPFVEIGLGLALMFARTRTIGVYAWFVFMLTLLIGHYVLQEWSAVNQMIDYFLLGLICFLFPHHNSLFAMPIKNSDGESIAA